ncbi:MAG: hypothetical protein ACO3KD_04295 [Gaiellales bacterium]
MAEEPDNDDGFDPTAEDEVDLDDPDALADEDWSDFTYGQAGEDDD